MNSSILSCSAWAILRSGPCHPHQNMAIDDALLEHSAIFGTPLLRFYAWSEPAATFGYFQHYHEIATWTSLRPLIRRPTGGGLVPHDHDWTYSVVIPPNHPWYKLKAAQSYQLVHEWLREGFAAIGFTTHLAPAPVREGIGRCFIGAEQHDLLWQARKIAGAAQRRNKQGLLIQGSVQPPTREFDREDWEAAMRKFINPSAEWELPETLRKRADQLALEQYSQPAYNERR
jgi:lipoyl(octanoyl) transferase